MPGILPLFPINTLPKAFPAQNPMRPSLQKRLLRAAGFLLLPLFCLTCLMTCSVMNPMGVVFLTSFEVVNATGEDLLITPIGARGPKGVRGTLPISSFSHFYIMSPQNSQFSVPAGTSLSLTYDSDDVQFTEIVCQRPDGSHVIVPTGLHPTQGQYRAPPTRKFEITDFGTLQPATDLHLKAIPSSKQSEWLPYFLAALGLLSPVCFRLAKRIQDTDAPAPTPSQAAR